MPSPSQSPAMGRSPPGPSPNDTVMFGSPGVLLLRRKKVEVLCLYNPIVTVPLPSQSPTIGRSPGAPNDAVISGNPGVLVLRKKKKLPAGLKSPIVSVVFAGALPQLFRRIDTVEPSTFATARSSLPSPLKSPTATERGVLPAPKSLFGPKLPV